MIARFPIVLMVALGATASVAKEGKPVSSEQKGKIFISSRSGLHGEIIPMIIYLNAATHVGKRINSVRGSFNAAPPVEKRISSDRGGVIADYVNKFSDLATSGTRVVIDGRCDSACTLSLGMIPRQRLCITRRSTFGFHIASRLDQRGRRIADPVATKFVLDTYPRALRNLIVKTGGLTTDVRQFSGTQIRALMPGVCSSEEARPVADELADPDSKHRMLRVATITRN
jgi:hypothetical protein